jgi:hypothetical protein
MKCLKNRAPVNPLQLSTADLFTSDIAQVVTLSFASSVIGTTIYFPGNFFGSTKLWRHCAARSVSQTTL